MTYTPILSSRPGNRHIRPGVKSKTTLITRHIVTYIWTEFETSLTHQINLIVLMCFNIVGKVTVNLTYSPILDCWSRSGPIFPGVMLQTTLIIRRIATYICPGFEISLRHQNNLNVLICFIFYKATQLSMRP